MRIKFLCLLIFAQLVLFLQVGYAWSATAAENAREAIRVGKYDQALKIIDGMLDENPIDPNAHLEMTEYYLALQDYRAAELSCERTLVANRSYAPHVAQVYYGAAERAMKQNQLPQALALYETAITLDGNLKNWVRGKYLSIGHGLLARGKFATAVSAYNQEIGLNPVVKKTIADTVFPFGFSLLGTNDKVAEMLLSYAVSLDSSYSPKATQVRMDYGLDLLNRARVATGEQRWKLREQSLRYVSKDIVDIEVPAPGWVTVFKQEYMGKGMNDEDGVIMTPHFGTDVKPGERIVITGKEFQFLEEVWKNYKGSFEIISKSMATDKIIGIRAKKGERITMEVQKLIDQQQ
jgi:tetratricopeptide (TPR) repeat protein